MKRTPLNRRTPMKRTGRIKPRSDKREDERVVRDVVREQVARRDIRCRAWQVLPGDCSGPDDVHELVRRGQWRAGYLDPDNCVLVCRHHHDYIGAHRDEAAAVGLHLQSWERPGGL